MGLLGTLAILLLIFTPAGTAGVFTDVLPRMRKRKCWQRVFWLLLPCTTAVAQSVLTSGVPVRITSSATHGFCIPGTEVCCHEYFAGYVIDVPDNAVRLDAHVQYASGWIGATGSYGKMPEIRNCTRAGNVVYGDFEVSDAVSLNAADCTYVLARDGRSTGSLRTGKYYFALGRSIIHDAIDATFTVTYYTQGPAIGSNSGVLDAAMFKPLLIPGGFMAIFGAGIGPVQSATLQLTPDGRSIATTLAGVNVYVNGLRAPITYASRTQVNAIVPFGLNVTQNYPNSDTLKVELEYNGARANTIYQWGSTARAGTFIQDWETRQGAVLSENLRPNSPANPAKAGSVIVVYTTGLGPTTPQVSDGLIPSGASFTAAFPVRVYVGVCTATPTNSDTPWCPGAWEPVSQWQQCDVLYAGAAPTLVSGVFQINCRLPPNLPAGRAAIGLSVKPATSDHWVNQWASEAATIAVMR